MTSVNPERKSVLIVHPTGNANVRQAAEALHEAHMLHSFYTTVAWRNNFQLNRFLPSGIRSEVARRSYPHLPTHLVRAHPWREIVRQIAMRKGWKGLYENEKDRFSLESVCTNLDRTVAHALTHLPAPDAVYAYEDCALQAFMSAKERGIRCIYELPIGHYRVYRRIVEEERELKPEWATTLTGMRDTPEKLGRKDREIEEAESIVVASSFTADTLKSFPGPIRSQIYLLPYGGPPVGPPRQITRRDMPLRIIFVGSIGQRKGIAYLIEAIDLLKIPYTLTMLGHPVAVPPVMKRALERHQWIASAPHAEVLTQLRTSDVLVLPSLFEGFGLVILEAMAQGAVVIASPNTAAPDIFQDGEGGYIVPIRSAEGIARRLTQLGEDRDLLMQMSLAAQENARQRSWQDYRHCWLEAIRREL